MSENTKIYKIKLWFWRIFDLLILVVPTVVYVCLALTGEAATVKKIAVIGAVAVALIIILFNVISQNHLRSPIWLIFCGLYIAVDRLIILVLINAIAAILDEFVCHPLICSYKIKYTANKEIDKRL